MLEAIALLLLVSGGVAQTTKTSESPIDTGLAQVQLAAFEPPPVDLNTE